MATYLPGVTDTGFNPVSYSPNLPFLMDALQKVTARYEKNYNEMAQGYSSILNADIFNDKKSKEREGYLNNIKDKLKTVSTTDLSVQSNIDAANSLYTPFWEDKSMLSHIADTKARKKQLLEQERIKKEHPDYDNTTPTTVMNYYINKIKTAENPDIINQTPLISAVGLKNNPKEFQEWLKKNDWKQEASVSQDGRIYKQVNGDGSYQSYNELFKTYLGNSAEDQYNMYGEYFKIQAVQKIQYDKKLNEGLDISEEAAIELIPKFYVNEQLENYNSKKKQLVNQINTVGENIKKFSTDPLKQKLFNEQLVSLDEAYQDIDKKEILLKTQGGTKEDDIKEYNNLINSIKINPTSFFANLTLNKDTETAAKMAASNQSLTISTDEAALAFAKLQQEAYQHADKQNLEYAKLTAKIEEDADGNLKSKSKGSKLVDSKIDENGVVWENATPIVTDAQSNNDIVSVVTRYQNVISEFHNQGISSIVDILQSTKSNIFAGIIDPQDTSVIAKAYKENSYTPEYTAIVAKTKKALIQNGASEKEIKEIKGPVGLLLALGRQYTSQIDKKIKQKEFNLKNGKPDKEIDAQLTNEYGEYIKVERALLQIKDAFKYKDEFDKAVNKKIQNNPDYYKKIAYTDKKGVTKLLTAEVLSDALKERSDDALRKLGLKANTPKLPANLAQMYIDGTLKLEPKNGEDKRDWFEKTLDRATGESRTATDAYKKTLYFVTDPETGIEYNVQAIVNEYGQPKELHERLNKTILSDKSLMPANLQKIFKERTGEMGRTITWTSSTGSETDYADKLANNIGQNLSLYMVQKGDGFNIINADKDLAKTLNSGVISQIQSTPIKGLTSVKYNPIGSSDPSKRNITLVYDTTLLLGANKKDYPDWNGSITFEIKSDAEIPGIPKAASGSYYDFLLSKDPRGIKQNEIDEKFGLKYQFYKDQNNQVQYKAGYQTVIEDPQTKVLSYVWKSVDVNAGTSGPYVENGGFSVLPSSLTVEDVIERLRQIMYSSIIPDNNTKEQKHYPSPTPVSIADQKMMDDLNKSNANILNKYK